MVEPDSRSRLAVRTPRQQPTGRVFGVAGTKWLATLFAGTIDKPPFSHSSAAIEGHPPDCAASQPGQRSTVVAVQTTQGQKGA